MNCHSGREQGEWEFHSLFRPAGPMTIYTHTAKLAHILVLEDALSAVAVARDTVGNEAEAAAVDSQRNFFTRVSNVPLTFLRSNRFQTFANSERQARAWPSCWAIRCPRAMNTFSL